MKKEYKQLFSGLSEHDKREVMDLIKYKNDYKRRMIFYGGKGSEETLINDLSEDLTKAVDRIKELEKAINDMKDLFQMIIDYGFDYDGFSRATNLRNLIDALVVYARMGRKIAIKELGEQKEKL